MKKLLLFLFVVCAVFAGAWNDAYWDYHNPNIYHFLNIEVWNTETMHQTLISLDLGSIDISMVNDNDAKTALQKAVLELKTAEISKKSCEELYASTVSSLPEDAVIAGLINPAYLLVKINYLMAIEMLDGEYGCSAYGTHWKAVMDNAQTSLYVSKNILNEKAEDAKISYFTAKNAGICDDDFYGEAKELCKYAEFDYGTLTGKYIPDFNNYYDYFSVEGGKNAPNMTGYSNQVNNIFNKVQKTAENTTLESNEAFAKAEEQYGFLKINAEQKMKEAKQKLNKLENEKFGLITGSVYSEESKGTIADRYSKLKEEASDADSKYVNAVFSSSATSSGYLKNSIKMMIEAYSSYDEVVNESDIIFEEGKRVAMEQRDEASKEIAAFEQATSGKKMNTAAKELYDSANKNFVNGDDSEKTGDKFHYYSLSAEDARKALTKNSQTSADLEAEINAQMKKTNEMLENAKKDGLDVYLEEEELKLLAGIKEDWVLDELGMIQNNVIELAQIKYGYLEDKREELLEKIALSGGKLDDLLVDMKKKEGNAFDGTKLDVEAGLGNLANIAKEYVYMEGEIEKEMKTIVENGLNTDMTLDIGVVELDAPVDISAYLFVANPYGYEASSVGVKVKVPVELKENEITEGAEYVDSVSYSSGNLNMRIGKINPYEQIKITFKKQAIIATVTKKTTTVTGNPDGNADAKQRIEFETSYDSEGTYVPEEFKSWTIDGKNGIGSKTGRLIKGNHILEGTYKIADAFEISKNDFKALKAGLNSEVSYELLIEPIVNMDSASIVINEESSDRITGFAVTSYGGAAVKSKKSLGNNMYGVELSGLKANETSTLRVSYTIEGSKEYANEQLALLEKGNWSAVTETIMESAKTALAENDTRRAVEYIEQAKAQIEKEKLAEATESTKLEDKKEIVEVQQEEVEAALEIAKENNLTQTTYQLENRNNELESAMSATSSAELSGFDSSWAKKKAVEIRKDSFEQYNSLKEEYLKVNNGIADDPIFREFEDAYSKLEATGSLEDAVSVRVKLEAVETFVNKKTSAAKEEKSVVMAEAELLKTETEAAIGPYSKEYDAAKGTTVSALFGPDYKMVQKEVTALGNLLFKEAPSAQITDKMKTVQKMKDGMSETMAYLKEEAQRKLESLKQVYDSRKNSIDESDRVLAEQGILKMESQVSSANYAEALITGDAVSKILNRKNGTSETGMIVLGITALLLISAVIIYLVKGGKKRPRRQMTLKSIDDL